MPPGDTAKLADSAYVEIIAYILERYGDVPGPTELPKNSTELAEIRIPSEAVLEPNVRDYGSRLGVSVQLPKWPERRNPLDKWSTITDSVLNDPPPESWLSWRRTLDSVGFSPLRQVTSRNVAKLRVAWTLALPPGPNEATPLVHRGVLFVHAYGDHIQALDAITGDELWHYYRDLPRGIGATVHRNLALFGDNLYFTTSDAHVVALNVATGMPVWEQAIGDVNRNINNATGGPLVARGVVMQGVNSALSPGGGYIVGLNARTGAILWKFNTIAQAGDPNGKSWNGLPVQKRTGGSVWTAGSYDADQDVAFFGPAPTYDTEGLRNPIGNVGVTTDALYTNATVALRPETGALVWYYQHFPNDQWDQDWAFERQVLRLPNSKDPLRIVITAGKEAVYDALDPTTGRYLFSIDLGLQNLILDIDPKTGHKSIDRALTPNGDTSVTVCPQLSGAKSWLPGSYDPRTGFLYVPLVESCMDMSPSRKGWYSGVTLRPRADSDGKYGRLQAIDLSTHKTVWISRQRAPQTTGALATAGGIVFAGALDRWFKAYDSSNGAELWRIRLSDVPNSAPISYAVDGRQYIAVVVGSGYGQTETFLPLVPEIRSPISRSSTIWVFALKD